MSALSPDALSVDVSPYAVQFRKTRGLDLIRRLEPFRNSEGVLPPALEAVSAQLALPFEVRATEAFARERGIPCVLVGDSDRSKTWLALLETELFAPENLTRLASEKAPGLAEQAAWEWARARRCRSNMAPIRNQAASEEDARMAQILLTLPDREGLIHVTGWEHLAPLARILALPEDRCLLTKDVS